MTGLWAVGFGTRSAPRAGGASHDLFVAPRLLLVCPCGGSSIQVGGVRGQTVAKRARAEAARRRDSFSPCGVFRFFGAAGRSPEPKSRQPEGARFSRQRGALVIDFGAGVEFGRDGVWMYCWRAGLARSKTALSAAISGRNYGPG